MIPVIFEYQDHTIRTVEIDGEILICGNDLARCLGRHSGRAMARIKDEYKVVRITH